MRRTCRQAKIPGNYIPAAGANKSAKDHMFIQNTEVNNTFADSICDMEAKKKKCDKIEKSRPNNGIFWRKHAGGDNGRDRIGGIMKTIKKIKY